MTIPPGERLGHYTIISRLGAGGMGEVYHARDEHLRRDVAIKVLPDTLTADAEALSRFQREARAIAALSHPNVVAIHQFDSNAPTPYLVMELLHGKTLRTLLREALVLQVARCAAIVAPVCAALEAAHAAGIVHRDIKPDNIFLHETPDGEVVKVVDFGIAKLMDDAQPSPNDALTQRGTLVGTPAYMAPERLVGSPYDARSDIYSVGVLAYHALTGEMPLPVDQPNVGEMVKLHLTTRPRPLRERNPVVPQVLSEVVMEALDYDPVRRPPLRRIAETLRAFGGGAAS